MKKLILVISFLLLCGNSYSQWVTSYTTPANQHFEVFFSDQNTGWLGGDGGKVFKTTNCGLNWNFIFQPSPADIVYCMYFIDNNKGWAGTFLGNVMKTSNGGLNWTTVQASNNKRIWDVNFANENTGWYVGSEGAYRKTTNGGNSWFVPGSISSNELYSIHFFDSQTGFVCGYFNIAKTTDGGSSWNISNYPNIYFTAIHFLNTNTGWILGNRLNSGNGSGMYVVKTTNSGINWNIMCSDTASYGWHTIVKDAHFVNENTGYFVGLSVYAPPPTSETGIMNKTTNSGITWNNVIVSSNIEAITFINQQTGFAAGGLGAIFKTTNGGPSFISTNNNNIPDKYFLYQNDPNPFNPNTLIKFQIKESGFVTMKVYNILGKEIATLINENLKAGEYETTFNGSGLSSGIYFYRMQIGDFVQTKKMTLLK
jgi:photosystem II stability/assembly factor-like uncharacterized protein